MIQLETSEEFINENADSVTATAWRLESSLREFPNFKPRNFWFEYPIHKLDSNGLLASLYSEGDPKGNLTKSGKRNQTPEMRKDDFDNAFSVCSGEQRDCSLDDLASYLGLSERTIRARVDELKGDYEVVKGRVRRARK